MTPYVPDVGDLLWLDFGSATGHEQAGRRPALCLSPFVYNRRSGLAVLCPITSHAKGYPFEVAVPGGLPVVGVVLADHVRSLDWLRRRAEFICDGQHDLAQLVASAIARLLPLPSGPTSAPPPG